MKRDRALPSIDTVVGLWEIVVNYLGDERSSTLKIDKAGSDLSAPLHNDEDGDLEITAFEFDDEVLRHKCKAPPSQMNGKNLHDTISAWLKVSEDSLDGALSLVDDIPLDLPLHGRRQKR